MFLSLVRFLARWFPEMTMSTGVTAKMCRRDASADDEEVEAVPQIERSERPLWHSRISFGWAAVLLKSAQLLNEHVGEMPVETSVLLTQGADDPVCLAEITRSFNSNLPQRDQRYVEFEGGLHELFSDEGKDILLDVLNDWLESLAVIQD